MAGYTYTTNSVEETGLSMATADMNAQPSAGNPPNGTAWSNQDLLDLLVREVLKGQTLRFQTQILIQAMGSYPMASPENRAIVLSKLGLTAIAPLSTDDQSPILSTLGMQNFLLLSPADQSEIFTALGLA